MSVPRQQKPVRESGLVPHIIDALSGTGVSGASGCTEAICPPLRYTDGLRLVQDHGRCFARPWKRVVQPSPFSSGLHE